MGLSATQQYLVEASRSTGTGDYFRWNAVGASLGYTSEESEQSVRSLSDRKLIILLQDGDARLLAAGREMAEKLERKLGRAN